MKNNFGELYLINKDVYDKVMKKIEDSENTSNNLSKNKDGNYQNNNNFSSGNGGGPSKISYGNVTIDNSNRNVNSNINENGNRFIPEDENNDSGSIDSNSEPPYNSDGNIFNSTNINNRTNDIYMPSAPEIIPSSSRNTSRGNNTIEMPSQNEVENVEIRNNCISLFEEEERNRIREGERNRIREEEERNRIREEEERNRIVEEEMQWLEERLQRLRRFDGRRYLNVSSQTSQLPPIHIATQFPLRRDIFTNTEFHNIRSGGTQTDPQPIPININLSTTPLSSVPRSITPPPSVKPKKNNQPKEKSSNGTIPKLANKIPPPPQKKDEKNKENVPKPPPSNNSTESKDNNSNPPPRNNSNVNNKNERKKESRERSPLRRASEARNRRGANANVNNARKTSENERDEKRKGVKRTRNDSRDRVNVDLKRGRKETAEEEKRRKEGEKKMEKNRELADEILQALNSNPFAILKISKDCNLREAKKAHMSIMRRLHPDKNDSPNAHEAFIKVQKAFAEVTRILHYQDMFRKRDDDNNQKGYGIKKWIQL